MKEFYVIEMVSLANEAANRLRMWYSTCLLIEKVPVLQERAEMLPWAVMISTCIRVV